MSTFKLYSPALVMLTWALVIEVLGGPLVTVAGLAATGFAVEAHVMETRARRRDPWSALRGLLRHRDDRRDDMGGRRQSDNRRTYRDLWLVAITLLVVFALKGQHDNLARIQQSRQAATAVTCQVMAAVTAAGRSVIEGSAIAAQHPAVSVQTPTSPPIINAQAPETPFIRFLEQHGYPKPGVRTVQAQVQAEAYGALINRRVASAVGAKRAQDLVDHSGQIDCAAFARLVKLGPLK